MPIINIDDLCEPIEVTVGGKQYTVDDISRDVAKRMEAVGQAAEESGESDLNKMSDLMAEVLGADKADMAKLGLRKLLKLTTALMGTINEELEGKNVPRVGAAKKS